MADNTIIPPGAGGDTIRSVDRSLDNPAIAAKTQVMQLDAGGESTESLVSQINRLPVAEPDLLGVLNQILITLKAINLTLGTMADRYTAPEEMNNDSI